MFSTFAQLCFQGKPINLSFILSSKKNPTWSNLTCMKQPVLLWVANLFTDKLLANLQALEVSQSSRTICYRPAWALAPGEQHTWPYCRALFSPGKQWPRIFGKWQESREKKLQVVRITIKRDLLANACCKTNDYREAGASETPVFTNCFANHYKLSISMPAVLHQNTQSLFFDILSICCSCIITDTSYKI